MQYLICGFSGSGKSHSLEKIQSAHRYPDYVFIDLDRYLEQREGMSIGQIVLDFGEQRFRDLELFYLKEVLTQNKRLWLSLGGGTLCKEALDFIADSSVILYWLNTPFELCWERIKDDQSRFLTLKGKHVLKELYEERLKIFTHFQLFDLLQHT
jgi:shikimate kinase